MLPCGTPGAAEAQQAISWWQLRQIGESEEALTKFLSKNTLPSPGPKLVNHSASKTWSVFCADMELVSEQAWKISRKGLTRLNAAGLFRDFPELAEFSKELQSATGFSLMATEAAVGTDVFLLGLRHRQVICRPHFLCRSLTELEAASQPTAADCITVDMTSAVFGYAATLQDPDCAHVLQLIGEVACRVIRLPEIQGRLYLKQLENLFWATFQRGLCKEQGDIKAYGAMLLACPFQLPLNSMEVKEWNARAVLSGESWAFWVSDYRHAINSTLEIWKKNSNMARACLPLREYFQPCFAVGLVDRYSSGRLLVQKCRSRDMQVICVRSTLQIKECDVQSYQRQLKDFHSTCTLEASDDFDVSFADLCAELRLWGLKAVIPGSELGVELADRLAAALELRGNNPCSTVNRKDKHAMQEALRKQEVPSALSFCGSLPTVKAWIAEAGLSYPVILKPPVSFATEGVFLCSSITDVEQAFAATSGTLNAHGVQISAMVAQEFLDGREFMVDTVSKGGEHTFVAAWEHSKSNASKVMARCSTLLQWSDLVQDLFDYACKVLDALGVRYGAANLEIMDVNGGRGPVLVEINARMIGHIGPEVIEQCLGLSLPDLVLDAFTDGAVIDGMGHGQPPFLQSLQNHARIIRLISPKEGVLLNSIDCEEMRQLPSFASIHTSKTRGSKLEKTCDKMSTAGMVLLVHKDIDAIEKDTQRIQDLEQTSLYDCKSISDINKDAGHLDQKRTCSVCAGSGTLLDAALVRERLSRLPMWSEGHQKITRNFVAKNFQAALNFIKAAGEVAEVLGHHPDLHLEEYRKVRIDIYSHKLGGLTEQDFLLAAKLDAIEVQYSPKWLQESKKAAQDLAIMQPGWEWRGA